MRKRAYLAALAVCIALTGSACVGKDSAAVVPRGEENTEVGKVVEPQGFGTRLVSVDDTQKYIALAQYKGLLLDKSVYSVTEEEVEAQVRAVLQSERKEVTDGKATVQAGDLITINYTGTAGNAIVESEDCYDLIVGENGMQAGFEDTLLGMKKGDTKTFAITFPEDFATAEAAGKTIVYRVTVQSIQRMPELTDKLAAAKTDAATLDEYRQMVREQLVANAESAALDAVKSEAWGRVLLNSEVKEYPKADIENAIDEFKKQMMFYNNESGMDLEAFVKSQGMTMQEFAEQCQQYAQSKVKQNLIIQAIMDAEGISLSDKECLAIQDQLILDFQARSLAELLDTYGQTMIDEAIGLLRIENFLVENAVFEERTSESAETEAAGTDFAEMEPIGTETENPVDQETEEMDKE